MRARRCDSPEQLRLAGVGTWLQSVGHCQFVERGTGRCLVGRGSLVSNGPQQPAQRALQGQGKVREVWRGCRTPITETNGIHLVLLAC
jgi:hypothetical protein